MESYLKDVVLKDEYPNHFLADKHIEYIVGYSKKKDDFEFVMTEHFRMSGIFWGLSASELLRRMNDLNKSEILQFVQQCRTASGGYAPSLGHDPHLLYTLSAVQVLALLNALDEADKDAISAYVRGLQNPDGSFSGDEWGEVDTRFSFCAVACLSLINRLEDIDLKGAVEFVLRCQNADGGFGTRPGSESHAGQIYCCVGLLSIAGELDRVNGDLLGWWLCERQLPSGGLNGRPEKLPDVCYSWWVLASLKLLGRLHWIHKTKMIKFILATQDIETGGFTDRPGDVVDLFHTLFGLAGLSLLSEVQGRDDVAVGTNNAKTGINEQSKIDDTRQLRQMGSKDSFGDESESNIAASLANQLKKVNPVFCMSEEIIQRLGISVQICSL